MNTLRRDFFGGGSGSLPHQLRVPTGSLGQGDGKHGAIAVNRVLSIENRNAQTALFLRDSLSFGLFSGSSGIEKRTPAALANFFLRIFRKARRKRRLRQLAQLLRQSHLREKGVDPSLNFLRSESQKKTLRKRGQQPEGEKAPHPSIWTRKSPERKITRARAIFRRCPSPLPSAGLPGRDLVNSSTALAQRNDTEARQRARFY